jgi:hypothetical protein
MFTQMFKAVAPENARRLLSHKDQTRHAVKNAYKVFFTDHRLRGTKRHHRFMPYQKIRSSQIWNNNKMSQLSDLSKGNKTGNHRISTTGATTVPEDKVTDQTSTTTARTPTSPSPTHLEMVNIYCKILNHAQEECCKRINDNKPCVTNKEQLYWPKVNSTTENPNTVQNNSNPINSVFL